MHGINGKAYLAMVNVYREGRWPENHVLDLFECDASNLGCFPTPSTRGNLPDGQPFAWIVRDMGTFMDYASDEVSKSYSRILADEIDNGQKSIDAVRSNPISHTMAGNYAVGGLATFYRYYWWDGETLMQVASPHTLMERMRHWQWQQSQRICDSD